MKQVLAIVGIALLSFSCKEKKVEEVKPQVKTAVEVVKSESQKNIERVFKAHGGLNAWKQYKSLDFTIKKETGNERTLTNLQSRKSLIETPDFKIGYNGDSVWLNENEGYTYKGNPKFYYNLMFYFYAMPFILADNGIEYSNVAPLTYQGVDYPGVKITYKSGVGESSDDEYVLYYNPTTYKMEWLGYTVTYFTKEKSKDWHFIKYTDWQTINDLSLPKTISWYKSEGTVIGDKKNDVNFIDVKLSKTAPNDILFNK